MSKKILVTCPPMIEQISNYKDKFEECNFDVYCPEFQQTMTEDELINIVTQYDGWIIGDDPATRKVFEAGAKGKLKACVKWGVGVDNVDFDACKDLNIPISNTPGMFGEEVSDIAIGYLLCLTRKIHTINEENRKGNWVKPCGISLTGKKVCLIGFGDIGRCTARKLLAFNLNVYVSDPGFEQVNGEIKCKYNKELKVEKSLNNVKITNFEDALTDADFIILTCALNKHTYHLLNKENITYAKSNVKIINVARGPLIKEDDVVSLQEEGFIDSVAFDVFEEEPLNKDNKLLSNKNNMFGSHNGSNTLEAVNNTTHIAIDKLNKFLNM